MDVTNVLVFAGALAVATAAPGPTVVTLVARVLALGWRPNLAFVGGLLLGDVVWLGCAVFGVAALAATAHVAFVALKWLGAAYLLYLAWKLWTAPILTTGAPAPAATAAESRLRQVTGGLAVAIANPKTMMFYLALVPNLISVGGITVAHFAELVVVLVVVYGTVLGGYVAAAARARQLLASPRAIRLVNRGSAVAMAGTAAAVAARE